MHFIFVVAAVLTHLVFLYAVFDVYFTSPLVHGMTPHAAKLSSASPAKRLVLFVADGLRADRCFELGENGLPRTPFIRKIVQEKGAWGVSHTRVPTESRPGHVALIAGFYEDVSAIAKGWKDNPVPFDSVFNKSRQTWSWGSPDILPMFAKGIAVGHVVTHAYAAESEDFAGRDLHKLDTWVFNEVEKFFKKAQGDSTLDAALRRDKLVFFLHLLGIDTNGHAHNPQSAEYLNNIQIVDEGIKNITSIVDDFYGDGRTAYVMTADHGMTSWGSHGAGHPHETLTPLVLWGAGVRSPVLLDSGHPQSSDQYYCSSGQCSGGRSDVDVATVTSWNLSHLLRQDVDQADVAPLMAALLGLSYPANSAGILRTGFLNMSDHDKAQNMLANALQVVEQFKVKEQYTEKQTLHLLFRPFSTLTPVSLAATLRRIKAALTAGRYEESELLASTLVTNALAGLAYYHSYERTFLGMCLVFGFTGWMAFTLAAMLQQMDHAVRPSSPQQSDDWVVTTVFLVSRVVIALLLAAQNSPWSYYLYCFLPTWLWEEVFKRRLVVCRFLQRCVSTAHVGQCLRSVVFLAVGLEIMVYSFFYRELLSVGLVCLCTVPSWTMASSGSRRLPRHLLILWCTSCLGLAIFPLLPVVGRSTQYNMVLLAACWAAAVTYYKALLSSEKILKYQAAVLVVAGLIVKWTSMRVEAKAGVSLVGQIGSWTILGSAFVTPLMSSTQPSVRMFSIGASLVTLYLSLSISHESLFILVLCFFLYSWFTLESHFERVETPAPVRPSGYFVVNDSYPASIQERDIRTAFLFIFIITVGFFGTGNIASVNSFEPASVYCYLTIFNPFLMGALLLLKVIVPFLLVSCTLSLIHQSRRGGNPSSMTAEHVFLKILLMSDFMGLHFFFLIKNEGSWLDIGTSISHYVIALSTTTVLLLFYEVAQLMTTWSLAHGKELAASQRLKPRNID